MDPYEERNLEDQKAFLNIQVIYKISIKILKSTTKAKNIIY